MKESKELCKIDIIQLRKIKRITDITQNKEKSSVYYQN